jgi:iron complex outermembrane receptor protein
VFANARYTVAPDINLSLRGTWNRRESKNQAAPLPFGFGPTSGLTPVLSNLVISRTNPFNPFGVDLGGANGNVSAVFRRFIEGGPRRFSQQVDTAYGVATLDGKLGSDWFWDVNVSYGRNKADQAMFGNIDSSKLQQAVGPLAQCTAPCVPFNFFGGAGSITPAMLAFVTFEQNDSSEQTQFNSTANLSGSLLQLPGGPLGLAVGLEYRRLRGRFDPDPIVSAGFSSDIPAQPTRGGYNVREAFAELNAPLLSDLPGLNLLELNGAVRVSDYSTSGSNTTFKAGVNWKPIKDLRIRGSWAQGFRAPQIGELFGSQSRFDEVLDDPCSSHASNAAPQRFSNDATVRAACIAAGVPANGSYQQANAQISVNTGGNRALKPEESESWVYGFVFSPSFSRGLSIETNWYRIKVEGAIQAIPRATTLLNCLLTNDPSVCSLITRVNGQLTEVEGLLQNIAAIKTSGVDLNISHRGIDTRAGRFGFSWNNTFLSKYDVFVPGPSGTQLLAARRDAGRLTRAGFPQAQVDCNRGLGSCPVRRVAHRPICQQASGAHRYPEVRVLHRCATAVDWSSVCPRSWLCGRREQPVRRQNAGLRIVRKQQLQPGHSRHSWPLLLRARYVQDVSLIMVCGGGAPVGRVRPYQSVSGHGRERAKLLSGLNFTCGCKGCSSNRSAWARGLCSRLNC